MLGIGALIGSGSPGQAPSTAPTESADAENTQDLLAELARRTDSDPFALGSVDAPVVIVEYADFACPYCAVFAHATLPAIVEQYVDSGQVRIEWRDTPVLGESSVDAAVAGHAAAQQGKFWDWYHAAFAHTYDGNKSLDRDALITIASQIDGLDLAQFTADLDRTDLREAVTSELQQAKSIGISGVPVFIVGNQVIQGAQPLEAFQQAIDAQLTD